MTTILRTHRIELEIPPRMPDRSVIRRAVMQRLSEISQTAGYLTTPKTITDVFKTIDQYLDSQLPALTVTDAPASELNLIAQREVYEHRYTMTIWGFTKGTPLGGQGKSRADALEDLWDDIVRRIIKNSNIRIPGQTGSPVVLRIVLAPNRSTDGGVWDPYAAFTQDVTVTFFEKFHQAQ